ncbi:helix-turn-helix domain-containing protein [Pseudofrankia inefficax]|uniref:Helix-turn-helix domain protein n=1 Tax=Pseudofrankia inefficax (strain DSM 45817 / CECT 9037 / DDB 130130 / EuI1c) TaxID=298654 RepID=E3J1E3_PSEI1|nr:XRE family transcriptional regulator [Pseudofrankia inefficax]ADP80464.1 helix-turn-helix domain protein [Pseudofrankia inefficax]
MSDTLGAALAATVRSARAARGLTVAGLADASGVSRAMISKVERAEAQPTAALLAKLSGALGLTLSELIARAESGPSRLTRHGEQPLWTDPDSGYSRRAVSPPASTGLELVQVELPAGATVAMPASTYRFIDQQIWVLAGRLRFVEGDDVHELGQGDCLQLGAPADCVYVNPTEAPCRYLVALYKVSAPRGLTLTRGQGTESAV